MEEKLILSIELQKGQNEKEIDALTRKITELQVATANLQKQNNELIKQGKQNSEEYVENTRQVEINKQKINEAISARKGMVQSLLAEDNSIKSLNVRNAELKKQRDLVNTSTKEGRAEISRLNTEIDRNNEVIEENLDKAGKQKAAIGGYTDAIKNSIPFFRQAEQAQAALGGGMSLLNKIFLASGIGLFIAALASLIAYFKGSEEGQNRLNKIMAIGSAIFEQFMNIVEDVGEALFNAFTNPKQALIDFGDLIKEQIENRIIGMITLIPKLGAAMELLFEGEFAAAAKVAGDAVGQVVLGITNATDKIAGFIDSTIELVNQGIENGERLAEFQANIDREARKLVVEREKTNAEVQKLRAEALKFESDERKKILLEAIALEERLGAQETALAKTRLANAELLRDTNGNDKAALDAVAEARAAVFAAEAKQFADTLRFRREIAAIDEASAKEQTALLAEANKMLDEAERLELERQKRIQEALVATEELRLEQAVAHATSIEDRVNKEIELETFKTFALLDNQNLLEAERQLIIEKSQAAINAIIVKGTQETNKKVAEEEKKQAALDKQLQQQKTQGREAAANAAVGFARAAFGETKGVAIAEATINTIQGVARALSDYIFPYSLIVGALVGAAGLLQVNKIINTKPAAKGMLLRKIATTGGMLRGPSHARGGIPFSVAGQEGFEAEGEEAIINRRSSKKFRKELSAINSHNGWGVPFGRGGVTTYQTGSIIGATQTRQAASVAESRSSIQDAMLLAMQNMPPTFVSVVDINERASEVAEQSNKAFVV